MQLFIMPNIVSAISDESLAAFFKYLIAMELQNFCCKFHRLVGRISFNFP